MPENGGQFMPDLGGQFAWIFQLNYSAQQIRYWNEVPTVLLFSIVFAVVIKEWLSFFWGLSGLLLLMLILIGGIMLYKEFRNK